MNVRNGVAIAALLLLSPIISFAGSDTELALFKNAIEEKYEIKALGFETKDADLIVERFYSDDVIAVDSSGKSYHGRAELKKMYEEVVKIGTVRVESVSTKVSGDMGWDWANFYVAPDDPQASPIVFKIIFLWERRDGEWWCTGDMFVEGEFEAAH